jgi:hypothetical protein
MQDAHMCQKKGGTSEAVRRNVCAMRVVNWRCRLWLRGGCCERDWKWSPIILTWCSFCGHFGTRCIVTCPSSCIAGAGIA